MNNIHNDGASRQARDALDALLALTGALSQDMRAALGPRELTPARAHLLWVLGEVGEVTQRVLADRLDVTPRNVTALVDAMEAAGFVARRAHPADRRASVVVLTPKGVSALERLREERDVFAGALFGDFSASELDALVRMLGSLNLRLTTIAGGTAGDRDATP